MREHTLKPDLSRAGTVLPKEVGITMSSGVRDIHISEQCVAGVVMLTNFHDQANVTDPKMCG